MSLVALLGLGFERALVAEGALHLVEVGDGHEHVDGEQAVVLGDDDERVARPDQPRGRQRRALRDGQRLHGPAQVPQPRHHQALHTSTGL